MSYRCLPNLKAQLAKHNFKILNQTKNEPPPKCNCQDPTKYPLPGKCTIDNVVYGATVKAGNEVQKYVGLTANTFKKRYGGHKQNFGSPAGRSKTTLAGHTWNLKDRSEDYTIEWEVVWRDSPFRSVTGICNLCTYEKWNIIYKPEIATLNRQQLCLFEHF
jgi:hypothetical protein